MKYYIKVTDGDRYETVYNTLQEALESLREYESEGWSGLVVEDDQYKEYGINDVITEVFFNMLAEEKTAREIKKATGIKKIEPEERIVTIYYPNGEIISHWL